MLGDITLYDFKKVFIPSCKTGTPKTDDNLKAMVHYMIE